MDNRLILVGGGGHCKSCIDVIEIEQRYKIHGILDQLPRVGEEVLGYPIIGTDAEISEYINQNFYFLVTVGQIKSSEPRRRLYDGLLARGAKLATVVSPRAYVSKHVNIGQGTIVMHDALVNAGAEIGNNCIINTKSLIEHDARIEDHCHVATAAVVNGGVRLKQGGFFGSNAVSQEYIESATNVFIKAGSVFCG